MTDKIPLALAMTSFGQIGLCVSLLIIRSAERRTNIPLAMFFAACGVVIADPVLLAFFPAARIHAFALTLPAYLIMAPSLWLYVEGLTSQTPWKLRSSHHKHFCLFGLALFACGLFFLLPFEVRAQLIEQGELAEGRYIAILMTCIFGLVLSLIPQSAYYLVQIVRRLALYRSILKTLFSSNEQRELSWMIVLFSIMGGLWIIAIASLVADNFLNVSLIGQRTGGAMGLVLIWLWAVWGLRQKPGFAGRYQEGDISRNFTSPQKKYKKSALNPDQASRLVTKIKAAMTRDHIYLDPNLSLAKLAKHIGASPNFISQTLNENLGASFFDYINHWRIEAAKPAIILGEESVLTISLDVGFNARSSFYKAFKKETGLSPRDFRAAHKKYPAQ